jgi:ectoine hydroxylase-related dioxygenase (phytanoyl-CoA dioxygenase family)
MGIAPTLLWRGLSMAGDLKLQYENQGFIHLPGLLDPDLVTRVRDAFNRASDDYCERWQRDVSAGRTSSAFYDIPDILDRDPAFIELVDYEPLLPILLETVGDDIQLNHTHARVFPPGKTFTAPWHSDLADVLGIDLAHSINFFVKVHFYFEDLLPNQGCLAFIPGTHRLPAGAPRPMISPDSPVAVTIVPKAGDAVLFNTHVMHMALDNTSPKPRKSIIYAYSHFWLKNYANAVPSDVMKYATTRLKRQMFGVEDPNVSYFDQRYTESIKSRGSFRVASSRVFRRILKSSSISR